MEEMMKEILKSDIHPMAKKIRIKKMNIRGNTPEVYVINTAMKLPTRKCIDILNAYFVTGEYKKALDVLATSLL